MAKSGDNIVTTVDKVLKAYAPVLGRWLEANREFSGIRTFIGRDEPSAIPMNENGQGYRDEDFESMSKPILARIEDELNDIRKQSKLLKRTDRLSVWAKRDEEGIIVSAAANSMLGTAIVKRNAHKHEGGEVYTLEPCMLLVYAYTEDKAVAKSLMQLNGGSMVDAINLVIKNDVALSLKGQSDVLRKWLKAFPGSVELTVEAYGGPIYQVGARSSQGYHKILSDEAFYNEKIRGTELDGRLPIDVYSVDELDNILKL